MLRAATCVPAIAAALLVSAGPAAAESGPPGVWAAAAQYVEMIPTSTGPQAAGAPGQTKPLPQWLATELARSGGTDAAALETLVTSSGWGASTTGRPAERVDAQGAPDRSGRVLVVPLPEARTSPFEAVGDALTDRGRATLALVALVAMLTGSMLVRLRQ